MKSFAAFCWVITLICCCIGTFVVVLGLLSAHGAPQEAAVAGIGLAIAAIPYIFSRAVSELANRS